MKCFRWDDTEIVSMFERANSVFLRREIDLIRRRASERCLCGRLMLAIHEELIRMNIDDYYVDVEYNKNKGNKLDRKQIFIRDRLSRIFCDLIVHSRGENGSDDNILALEMKKTPCNQEQLEKDEERLEKLTELWERCELPSIVCGYRVGVMYIIDYPKERIVWKYYKDGIPWDRCEDTSEGYSGEVDITVGARLN